MTEKPTVLIVDDTPENIQYLGESLSPHYDILVAGNGLDALDIVLSETPPDLILLDILMPGMDGYELCTRLKSMPEGQQIPIIFLTVKDDISNETRGLELGAVDYIHKPFSLPIIKARINTHLELKRKTDLLARLSCLDGLTGIANRRHFDEMIEREWARCLRGQHAIALLMIDIDFFKPYNDHYGHGAGDDCIKTVANSLQQCLRRPADLLARYGGEEFCVILPATDTEGALRIAEDMRAAIEACQLPHQHSATASHVSISIGVASDTPDSDCGHAALLELADRALYQAKDNGRNRVQAFLTRRVASVS